MSKVRELTCINCPLGCSVSVKIEDGEIVNIEGNSCKRGEVYAKNEIKNPVRTITSTVKVDGGSNYLVPVKTEEAIPKGLMKEVMVEINKLKVKAPVHIGDVLIEDILDTGVSLVATSEA